MSYKALFLVLMLAPLSASAGVIMKGKAQATVHQLFGSSQKVNSEFETYLEDDRMRMNTKTPQDNTSVIVRSDKKLMWVLNHKTKTYTELNETHAKQFKNQFEQIRKDKQAAKFMDAMLNATTDAMKVDKFEPKGSDKAMGSSCDKYVGYRRGKKVMEVCVVPVRFWNTANAAQKKALSASKFLMDLFPPQMVQKQVSQMLDSSAAHLGFPVKVSYSMGGTVSSKSEITELSNKWFMDQSVFEIPAGYRKAKT